MERGISSLIDLWKEGYSERLQKHQPYQAIQQIKHIASLFSPGDFFYFILNMHNLEMEYVHPNVKNFMDVDPERAKINDLLEWIVPEDMESVRKKEMVLQDFLEKFEDPYELPFYKVLYMYRMKDRYNRYRTMLLQVNVLSVSDNGTIEHVLSVHTDISYLGVAKSDHISFISLNGNKSYYNVDCSTGEFDDSLFEMPLNKFGADLTKREQEIIFYFSKGLGAKEIGEALNISELTVRTHRKNILKKTKLPSMAELVSKCVMEGLI
ncbi:helix-turn-helix transcriptional regulator [Echinicola strongylocentroti]|nr:LuxR C-terminal-related transcriptional regulator [Echinicola strongylocentroti]